MNENYIIILVIVLIILLLSLLLIYIIYQNTNLGVTKYNIVSAKIPKEFDGFSILQISDFHNTTSEKLLNDTVDKIIEEKPNIIVITGDLVDARNIRFDIIESFISKICDVSPIYFIQGNHETRLLKKYDDMKDMLRDNGVKVLANESDTIIRDGKTINILGIDDPANTIDGKYGKNDIVIEKEIDSLEYDKDNYTILLSHRPEAFNVYVKKDMDLVFSGHAHGGQFRIPFIGGLFAPNQGFFPEYTEGVHKKGNTSLVISRGIGRSVIPLRINNNPEIVLVELRNN